MDLAVYFKYVLGEMKFIPLIVIYFVLEKYYPAVPREKKYFYENYLYLPTWILMTAGVFDFSNNFIVPYMHDIFSGYSFTIGIGNPFVHVLASLFLFDISYYWYHRLSHTRVLWFHHKFHHADEDMNVTTTWRTHWMENIYIVPFLPIAYMIVISDLTGANNLFTLFLVKLIAYSGLFNHSNIRLEAGWLSYVFTNPQYHRIHHSEELHHRNKNYAGYFPILDIVFGTFYKPAKGEWPRTGLTFQQREAYTLSDMMLYPIKSRKKSSS